jgi:hypothetical protein
VCVCVCVYIYKLTWFSYITFIESKKWNNVVISRCVEVERNKKKQL